MKKDFHGVCLLAVANQSQYARKKEEVMLVDESLFASIDLHPIEVLAQHRSEPGQSLLILAKTETIENQIEKLLGEHEDLTGHPVVMTTPGLFEGPQGGTSKSILIDKLLDFLASIRKTKSENAINDVCLIAPPGHQLKVNRREYLDLLEKFIMHDQLYIIELNRSLQATLQAMIKA